MDELKIRERSDVAFELDVDAIKFIDDVGTNGVEFMRD